MSVQKLTKDIWAELESHSRPRMSIQEEMVRRADEILSGGKISAPSLSNMVRNAIEKSKELHGRSRDAEESTMGNS